MSNELNWLVETCRKLGTDINLVQGTGGNISVKIDGRMLIKASGVRLDYVAEDRGYVILDYKKVAEIYSSDISEDDAGRITRSAVIGDEGKPSIETGFHTFLAKYVIHLHPVSLNAILCSTKGKDILPEIFKDINFMWVPYFKVGHNVSMEIKKRFSGEEIIFLENHGIIITSDNPNCTGLVDIVIGRINTYLENTIPSFSRFTYTGLKNIEDVIVNTSDIVLRNSRKVLAEFLFPDAAVFATSDKIKIGEDGVYYYMDQESARNIDEILSAHAYLHEMTAKIGGPKKFTESEVNDLLGMESEKYRRKLMGL